MHVRTLVREANITHGASNPMVLIYGVHQYKRYGRALHIRIHKHTASGMTSSHNLFSNLCNIASFATNRETTIEIYRKLTPSQVSVLVALFESGAEIDHFLLSEVLPFGSAARLGPAIRNSNKLRALSLGFFREMSFTVSEQLRMVAASASTSLESLSISFQYIDNENTILLRNSFGRLTGLRSLTISNCCCSAPLLVAGISKLRALESLEIKNVDHIFGSSTAAVPDNRPADIRSAELEEIREICLHRVSLKDEGISAIVDAIPVSARASQRFCLSYNDIGPAGERKLAGLIAHSPCLRCLCFKGSHIADTEAEVLGGALWTCAQSLEMLDVEECSLGPCGVASLLIPCAYPSLSSLTISENNAGELGAEAVAEIITHSGALRDLQIQDNNITEAGALKLANGLANAYTMQNIDIDENPIGSRGAAADFDALASVSTVPMSLVCFSNCNIGDEKPCTWIITVFVAQGQKRLQILSLRPHA